MLKNRGSVRAVLVSLVLVPSLISGSNIGGAVRLVKFDRGKLVLVCEGGNELVLPDGTFRAKSGDGLKISRGRPSKATDGDGNWVAVQSARIDGSGKLVLEADTQWSLEDGDYSLAKPPSKGLTGFKAEDGKIVMVYGDH